MVKACQTDDSGIHVGSRHKAVLGHIGHDIGLSVVLHCQRQGTVILGSRTGLHPGSDLFLNHDSHIGQGNVLLKQAHDDGRRDIVGQVCHHLDGPAACLFLNQLIQIQGQNVCMDHLHVVIRCQGLLQNRQQILVYLHCNNLAGGFGKILGHGADARTDLQHHIFRAYLGPCDDLVQHVTIDQKVLTESFIKGKIPLPDDLDGLLGIGQLFAVR